MKGIKVGRNHDDWSREFECENCGGLVEVVREDLYLAKRIGVRRMCYEVVADCFYCKNQIIIDELANRWHNLPRR